KTSSLGLRSNGGARAAQSSFINEEADLSSSSGMQADAVAFGTIAADITPATDDFFTDNDEFDLDSPTEGFASISEAIEDIRQGKFVIVVDDEDREN
ncbi:hypothetical protein CEJ83_21520, partial [Acinetobacter baumannii]